MRVGIVDCVVAVVGVVTVVVVVDVGCCCGLVWFGLVWFGGLVGSLLLLHIAVMLPAGAGLVKAAR